nr:hypothetical protein GCM10025699_68820 [Microbacterium flavescens]
MHERGIHHTVASSTARLAFIVVRPLGGASITEITSGLETPWSLVFRGDTPLVSERDTGRVLELAADGSTREIGTVAGVRHGGEEDCSAWPSTTTSCTRTPPAMRETASNAFR